MYKFFVDSNQIYEKKIEIIGTDVNHIKNVLRLKHKDLIYVCDKKSHANFLCSIQKIEEDKIICNINEKIEESTESSISIHIFQGLPKGEKMEYIIEKCTEIGVKNITPVVMERTIVKLDNFSKDKKILRWRKIAEVAAKQSKRDEILTVNSIISFDELFKNLNEYDILLLAYEAEKTNTLKSYLKSLNLNKDNLKIAVIVGPEGGISEKEVAICMSNGFTSVSLGKRILRAETAPLVISSNILYELEED